MKRILTCIMAFLLLTGLCACGGSGAGQAEAELETAAGTEANTETETQSLPGKLISAADAFAAGDGTPENPYQISTAAELALMAEKINGGEEGYSTAHYLLTADVALNDTSGWEGWADHGPEYRWIAIGDYRNGKAEFEGSFDGGGHVISGMYCYGIDTVDAQEEGNYYLGLFGMLRNATVKNVTLAQSCLIGKGQVAGMGGIAAEAWDSEITGCSSEAYLDCELATGGVGGVAGTLHHSSLSDSRNEGVIRYMGSEVGSCGGVAGYVSESRLEKCANEGSVSGAGDAGGIAGTMNHAGMEEAGVLDGCVNSGAVTGEKGRVGGIVGNLYAGYGEAAVTGCGNTGEITSDGYVGGLIGYVSAAKTFVDNKAGNVGMVTVSDCYNQGAVTLGNGYDSGFAGGLCGAAAALDGGILTVENSRSEGAVTAKDHVAGGIAGTLLLNYQGEILLTACENRGNVLAANGCYGGIAGMVTQTNGEEGEGQRVIRITDCSNSGALTGRGWNAGGIAGMVTLLSWDGDIFEDRGCVNSGAVTGKTSGSMLELGGVIGGMITTNGDLAVTDCSNSGAITLIVTEEADREQPVQSVAGGVVGSHAENVSVLGCTNSGVISVEGANEEWLSWGSISGTVKGVYSMEDIKAAIAAEDQE